MLQLLNSKLLILLVVLLAGVAGSLAYIGFQSRRAANAAAATEERKAREEEEARKFKKRFQHYTETEAITMGNADAVKGRTTEKAKP